MEKDSLLKDDQDMATHLEGKERPCPRLALTSLRACSLLLLLSIFLNSILVWVLARQQHTTQEVSEYGQSVGQEQRSLNI